MAMLCVCHPIFEVTSAQAAMQSIRNHVQETWLARISHEFKTWGKLKKIAIKTLQNWQATHSKTQNIPLKIGLVQRMKQNRRKAELAVATSGAKNWQVSVGRMAAVIFGTLAAFPSHLGFYHMYKHMT